MSQPLMNRNKDIFIQLPCQQKRSKMYKVHTADEVFEVETLQAAKDTIAGYWNESGEPDKSGFIQPWIEDEDGNEIPYKPSQVEIDSYK